MLFVSVNENSFGIVSSGVEVQDQEEKPAQIDVVKAVLVGIQADYSDVRETCFKKLELLFKEGRGFDEAKEALILMIKEKKPDTDKLEALLKEYFKEEFVDEEVDKEVAETKQETAGMEEQESSEAKEDLEKEIEGEKEQPVDKEEIEVTAKIDKVRKAIVVEHGQIVKIKREIAKSNSKRSESVKVKKVIRRFSKPKTNKEQAEESKKQQELLNEHLEASKKLWLILYGFVQEKQAITIDSPLWIKKLILSVFQFVNRQSKIDDENVQRFVWPCAMKLARISLWHDGWTNQVLSRAVAAADHKNEVVRARVFEFFKVLVKDDKIKKIDEILNFLPKSILDENEKIRASSLIIIETLLKRQQKVDRIKAIFNKIIKSKKTEYTDQFEVLLKKYLPEQLVDKEETPIKQESVLLEKQSAFGVEQEPLKKEAEDPVVTPEPEGKVEIQQVFKAIGVELDRAKRGGKVSDSAVLKKQWEILYARIQKNQRINEIFKIVRDGVRHSDKFMQYYSWGAAWKLVLSDQWIDEWAEQLFGAIEKSIRHEAQGVRDRAFFFMKTLVENNKVENFDVPIKVALKGLFDSDEKVRGVVYELVEQLLKRKKGHAQITATLNSIKKNKNLDPKKLEDLLKKYA